MSAADDLIIWNQHWKLDAGCIACRCCQAVQHETQKLDDFCHEPGCDQASMTATPWTALDSICDQLQTA
ncbi:hypothetical protein [Pseudomonas coronafaciens]|uniref:hypothetical protein n=1 Tax=Pseudomonas coronafaciens TaxID=53409 RepID=UPI0013C37BE0|nr:hypothetical protein [Pseudomonas coronafaciens]